MAPDDEQLSPEEKLLRVIQGSDSEGDAGEAPAEQTPAAPEPAAPADPAATSPARERPKLRVAEPAPASAPTAAEATPAESTGAAPAAAAKASGGAKPANAAPADAAAPSAPAETRDKKGEKPRPMIGTSPPVAMTKRPHQRRVGLRTLNRCLTALVLLLILFTAYEIWAYMQVGGEAVDLPEENDTPKASPQLTDKAGPLPNLAAVRQAFQDRPIIGFKEGPGPDETPIDDSTKPDVNQELERIKQGLDLIGTSLLPGTRGRMEAIIVDRKNKKLHFLQVGLKVTFEEQELVVKEIGRDRVVLTAGSDEIIIE